MVSAFDEGFVCELVVPPAPITKGIYWCDKRFHTASIIELYEQPTDFGLVIISGDYLQLGLIRCFEQSSQIKSLLTRHTHLQKSQRKGGQSAQRIGRLHDEYHNNYITLVIEKLDDVFDCYELSGLFIAGPSTKKEDLQSRLPLKYRDKLLGVLTTTARPTKTELLLAINPIIDNKKNIDTNKRLAELLIPDNQQVVYGKREVQRALRDRQLSELIVHTRTLSEKNVDTNKLREMCSSLNTQLTIIVGDSELTQILIDGYGGYLGVKWY